MAVALTLMRFATVISPAHHGRFNVSFVSKTRKCFTDDLMVSKSMLKSVRSSESKKQEQDSFMRSRICK